MKEDKPKGKPIPWLIITGAGTALISSLSGLCGTGTFGEIAQVVLVCFGILMMFYGIEGR